MKRHHWKSILLPWLGLFLWVTGAPAEKLKVETAVAETMALLGERRISDILGVTHTRGAYVFGTEPSILEGARRLESMGCRILKQWLTPDYRISYAWNSKWPEGIRSMKDLASTPYYQEVFAMKFHTLVLEAEEFSMAKYAWVQGLKESDRRAVHEEVYQLASWLLTGYRNTGKTFILQNWEADNTMKSGIGETNAANYAAGYQGFVEYIQTRQDAIEKARRDVGTNGVMVLHALEVNFVPPGFGAAGKSYKKKLPLVVDEVVPKTRCDLYSLSSWETWSPGTEDSIGERLRYLATKAPPSALFGTNHVMVGEFGSHEIDFEVPGKIHPVYQGDTSGAAFYANERMLLASLRAGARYILHWQLYANDLRDKVVRKPVPGVRYTAEQCAGNWLIRPDGSAVPTFEYFKALYDREAKNR